MLSLKPKYKTQVASTARLTWQIGVLQITHGLHGGIHASSTTSGPPLHLSPPSMIFCTAIDPKGSVSIVDLEENSSGFVQVHSRNQGTSRILTAPSIIRT